MRMIGFAAFAAAVIGVTASGALAGQQGPDDTPSCRRSGPSAGGKQHVKR